MSGASAEVRRKRNAAWPFGVATEGRFVPVLMATASRSNCPVLTIPCSIAALASLIYTVPTKTLSEIEDNRPLKR